jgi:hypothetical protein
VRSPGSVCLQRLDFPAWAGKIVVHLLKAIHKAREHWRAATFLDRRHVEKDGVKTVMPERIGVAADRQCQLSVFLICLSGFIL